MNWRDVGYRAAHTFLQAFLAFAAANLVNVYDWDSARVLFVACVAAGLSALKTTLVEWYTGR